MDEDRTPDPVEEEGSPDPLAQLGRFRSARRVGCLGFLGSMALRSLRFPRLRRGRLVALCFGALIVLLSVTTCSMGIDPASLTAEYGAPVPATRQAALRFVEKSAAAVQAAPGTRALRLTVTEAEATSAFSLGLMVPELTRVLETMPQNELHDIDDIERMRERIQELATDRTKAETWGGRLASILDPKLRTGDTQVRFTANGEIVTAGWVQAWKWRQTFLVVVAPSARSGEMELDFVKGRLGRLPAPEWVFDRMGALVSSLILLGRETAEISELTVSEGRLTFAAAITR